MNLQSFMLIRQNLLDLDKDYHTDIYLQDDTFGYWTYYEMKMVPECSICLHTYLWIEIKIQFTQNETQKSQIWQKMVPKY